MSDPQRRRYVVARPAAILVMAVASLALGCAKVEGEDGARSREPTITYYAARLIPMGKTVRAAMADGSITETQVPRDVTTDDELDTPRAVECLVAGRAIPLGSLLRRDMFVDPASIGLDKGLTDGTTLDPKC